MHMTGMLSRTYIQANDQTGALIDEIVQVTHLQPMRRDSLREIKDETGRDSTLQELIHVMPTRWPETVSEVKDILQFPR